MKTKTEEALCTSHNSGYMVPLRFTQIFAPLRSAKTSYSRETLCEMLNSSLIRESDPLAWHVALSFRVMPRAVRRKKGPFNAFVEATLDWKKPLTGRKSLH